MDVWQSLLIAIGGQAALLAALAWLARSFGSQLLAKDLEAFKAQLSHASSEASERLKHDLQIVAHEHQVRFSKLHERRAEVITSLYALLVEAQRAGQSFVSIFECAGEPPKAEKYVVAMNKFAEFFCEFDKNRIFLPEAVCDQFDAFLQGMQKQVIRFGVYEQIDEHAPPNVIKERYEVWTGASDYFNAELPRTRSALEAELRAMLAGAPNSAD
jgi:hypothetical protein